MLGIGVGSSIEKSPALGVEGDIVVAGGDRGESEDWGDALTGESSTTGEEVSRTCELRCEGTGVGSSDK
jgi:hypothetical protein